MEQEAKYTTIPLDNAAGSRQITSIVCMYPGDGPSLWLPGPRGRHCLRGGLRLRSRVAARSV